MEIVVAADDIGIRSHENVKQFAVVSDLPTDAVAEALVRHGWGSGSSTPDHVYISADSVREAAHELGADEAWDADFAGMLSYAASKDWLDPTGALVLAHVTTEERTSA